MKNYLLFNPYADGGKGKENAEALLPEVAKRFEAPETLSMVELNIEEFFKGLSKDDNVVIEVGADRVRVELKKWAISSNDSAAAAARKAAEDRKAERDRAKKEK